MGEWENVKQQLERQGKTRDLERLAQSADGQALGKLLDDSPLREAAAQGDGAAMQALLGQVLRTDEGRRLAEQIRRMMGGT